MTGVPIATRDCGLVIHIRLEVTTFDCGIFLFGRQGLPSRLTLGSLGKESPNRGSDPNDEQDDFSHNDPRSFLQFYIMMGGPTRWSEFQSSTLDFQSTASRLFVH